MSKYKARKTMLFTNIGRYAGTDARELAEEELPVVRALMMCGYLAYDDECEGMRIVVTPAAEEVLARE